MTLNRSLSIACALVFITPIGGVLVARFIGVGVNTSHASPSYTDPGPTTPLPPLEPQSDRATTLAALQSPFRLIDEAEVREVSEPGEPTTRGTAAPVFNLTAVMPHAQRPIAVINGRPRTIGEELTPGWTLTEIDGTSRTIVINGPDGDRVRVRMGNEPGGR
jgi:hypothetical protein